MAIVADTHRLITTLTQRGFTEEQAEAITDAIQEIDLDDLATKSDLEKLDLRLTIKLGGLISIGVAFLAFLKFFG